MIPRAEAEVKFMLLKLCFSPGDRKDFCDYEETVNNLMVLKMNVQKILISIILSNKIKAVSEIEFNFS